MIDSAAVKKRYFELAMRAAQEGDFVEVERLVKEHAIGINQKNDEGVVLLHQAAFSGNKEIIRFLLDKGAEADVKTKAGYTPLSYLLQGTNFSAEAADTLVAAGANVQHNHKGRGLVNAAINNRAVKAEAISWLAGKGVDVNINGTQTLDHPIFVAMQNQNIPAVRQYFDRGFDLTTRTSGGATLLQAALNPTSEGNQIQFPRPEVAQMIIEESQKRGIDIVNRGLENGFMPLHQVVGLLNMPLKKEDIQASAKVQLAQQMRITELLVNNGADVNAKTQVGETPLMVAASKGNIDLVNYLLSKGADPKVLSKTGYTAYSLAADAGYNDITSLLAKRMVGDETYKINSPSLPELDNKALLDSIVAYGTNVPVYALNRRTEEFRDNSPSTLTPLKDYKQKRQGFLMVNESADVHQIATYYSALNTYTKLTGASKADTEKFIMPLDLAMENLGNFASGVSPASQYSQGFRTLLESDKNRTIRDAVYFSASYGARDESSLYYKQQRAEHLKDAEKFYASLNLAGVGIAVGNDAGDPNFDTLGDSQPFRKNPGTVFIGAARKNPDGSVAMESYSTQGPHITALLPPYYDKLSGTQSEGTSFSAPAFNAYRLAVYNGTANLTPREIDAVFFTTASQQVVDPNNAKPYSFASNGTVSYNEKVGMGIADPAKAYTRAQELDIQKKAWLDKNGEDKPITIDITSSNLKAPKRIEVKGATKYEYSITVPETIFVQQLSSKTLTKLGDDSKLLASQARVVLPSGFTEHARQDAYGNATLPAMFGVKLNKGDVVKIVSDQPLTEAALNVTGYAPNSFFAQMMNQETAKRAAAKMKDVKLVESCAIVSAQIFNAKAAECRVR